jgi:hypothetical protein
MKIKVGQTVLINGEKKTIARLLADGTVITVDNQEYDAGFDIIEKAAA